MVNRSSIRGCHILFRGNCSEFIQTSVVNGSTLQFEEWHQCSVKARLASASFFLQVVCSCCRQTNHAVTSVYQGPKNGNRIIVLQTFFQNGLASFNSKIYHNNEDSTNRKILGSKRALNSRASGRPQGWLGSALENHIALRRLHVHL